MNCALKALIDCAMPMLLVAARLAGTSDFFSMMRKNCSARLNPSGLTVPCKSGPTRRLRKHRSHRFSISALRMSFTSDE